MTSQTHATPEAEAKFLAVSRPEKEAETYARRALRHAKVNRLPVSEHFWALTLDCLRRLTRQARRAS